VSTAPVKNDIPDASAAGLIATLAQAAAHPGAFTIDTAGLGAGLPPNVPMVWDPVNNRLVSVKAEVESFRQQPQRRAGTAKVDTLESFITLTNRHKTAASVIFAACKYPGPSLTAVIDYHGVKHEPDWLRHRISYPFPLTEEFKVWVEMNGKPMEQLLFAAFLEDHAAELAAPMEGEINEFERLFKARFATPNELIALSRSLEINVGSKVKQQHRLQTGERQVVFETEHLNGAGEPVDIPGIFILAVAPFVDGEVARIPARIRYRVTGGSIVWFFDLYRWEERLRNRVQEDLRKAAEGTSLPTYEGTPETGTGT